MARNYNPVESRPDSAPAGRGQGKKRGLNPMFVGIIIGLLLGIGLALGLAIWLNRANNPFIEKSRPVEALPVLPGRTLTPPTAQPASKGEAEKPRFEFYQILPGEKSGEKTGGKAAGKTEMGGKPESAPGPRIADPAPVASPETGSKVATEAKAAPKSDAKIDIKPASTEVFFLQAGAFQSATDAENVKAKVAFAGFEANVRPVNLPDKGTLYRVRLGPYKSLDEVNRIKATLSQGGIAAAVVKGSD